MSDQQSTVYYTGKIIFWNEKYGFIETKSFNYNVFFHHSSLNGKVNILDAVSFYVAESKSEKHKGKQAAYDISFKAKADFTKYVRKIGKVYKWNGKFGLIKYPTNGNSIILFATRVTGGDKIGNGSLVVFNPIKSNKNANQLFAFFAYPLKPERDLSIIVEEYFNHPLKELKEIVQTSSTEKLSLSSYNQFLMKLVELDPIDDTSKYLELKRLIKELSKKEEFKVDFKTLKHTVSNVYLIQLWEENIIEDYDVELLEEYFLKAGANRKRFIIRRIKNEEHKEFLFSAFLKYLDNSGKLSRVNNDLKTYLNIIIHDDSEISERLNKNIVVDLEKKLNGEEIISLWLSKYLSKIDPALIESHIKIRDFDTVIKILKRFGDNAHISNIIMRKFEDYFINLFDNDNYSFYKEYPFLVKSLIIINNYFSNEYYRIKKLLQVKLQDYQLLTLNVLGVDMDIDKKSVFLNNQHRIPSYIKIKYMLLNIGAFEEFEYEISIKKHEVEQFAKTYEWNNVIGPTKVIRKGENGKNNHTLPFSFLEDIEEFNQKYYFICDVNDLARIIYDAQPKYNVIHLRLWLHNYVSHDYFDYVGYLRGFKELTKLEKEQYKKLLEDRENGDDSSLPQEIKPCLNYTNNNDGSRTYVAYVENIYFTSHGLRLRLPNNEYTEKYEYSRASSGFNWIPENDPLNKFEVQFIVTGKTIEEVNGLDDLVTQVHSSDIAKAMGKTSLPDDHSYNVSESYAEDQELKSRILDYLQQNQIEDLEFKVINEPKSKYRRIEAGREVNDYFRAGLYTLRSKDGYAIVWESVDRVREKGTYVFKTSLSDYEWKIDEIATHVSTHFNLRSALTSSDENNKLLNILRNILGYVASIRKGRGKENAFDSWKAKLKRAMDLPIPDKPSEEDTEELREIINVSEHKIDISHKIPGRNYSEMFLSEDEIETISIPEAGTNNITEGKQISSDGRSSELSGYMIKQVIHQNLKSLNQYIINNL